MLARQGSWGSLSVGRRCRHVAAIVLLTLGTSLFILPLHLVHHWDDPSPKCQILAFAVALDASIPGASCLPVVECHWQELGPLSLLHPCFASAIAPLARAPPLYPPRHLDVSTS